MKNKARKKKSGEGEAGHVKASDIAAALLQLWHT